MSSEEDFVIWDGIYQEWGDAPAVGAAFNSSKWLDDQALLVSNELSEYAHFQGYIAPNAKSHDYILPTVIAMASADRELLKVLDFGGGMASSFLPLVASLPTDKSIEFHVVESAGICETGEKLFPKEMPLFFHEEFPASGHYDVIHAGRSFQYVDDWRGMLHAFAALTPDYLVLAGVLAGDIEPFVTLQNYYGYKIRVRFLNLGELIQEADSAGFQLLSKSLHLSKRLGKTGPLPMENLPVAHRLEYPCQLLFRARKS